MKYTLWILLRSNRNFKSLISLFQLFHQNYLLYMDGCNSKYPFSYKFQIVHNQMFPRRICLHSSWDSPQNKPAGITSIHTILRCMTRKSTLPRSFKMFSFQPIPLFHSTVHLLLQFPVVAALIDALYTAWFLVIWDYYVYEAEQNWTYRADCTIEVSFQQFKGLSFQYKSVRLQSRGLTRIFFLMCFQTKISICY